MRFPTEFKNLLGQFLPETFAGRTPEEAITDVLIGIGRRQCEVVKVFLDELFSGPYDVQELSDLWWGSSVEIAPTNAEEIPAFFKQIRALIDSPRVQSSPVP